MIRGWILLAALTFALALAVASPWTTADHEPERELEPPPHYAEVILDLLAHPENVEERIRYWFDRATQEPHDRHERTAESWRWHCGLSNSNECHYSQLTLTAGSRQTATATHHTATPTATPTPTHTPRPNLNHIVETRVAATLTALPTQTPVIEVVTATPCAGGLVSHDLQRCPTATPSPAPHQ